MSELVKLKSTLENISNSTKQTAGQLGQFKSKFAGYQGQVRAAIGGSSQRKDQEVMQSLDDASKKVEAAVNALNRAAQVASNYGRSM
jgi:uncharacterized protein YukE